MKDLTVFLPCRKGSQRVLEKNTRPFAGIEGGLLRLKLESLLDLKSMTRLILSTNDEAVIEIAGAFRDERLVIDRRPDKYASSSTSTDELVDYVSKMDFEGDILWTHVTSPFISCKTYERAIEVYRNSENDSLMSVEEIRNFLWTANGPLNYDPKVEKWPRTQTLEPVYEVNSAIFLAPMEVYRQSANRIGKNPYLFVLNHLENVDIDWPEDFEFAQQLYLLHQIED